MLWKNKKRHRVKALFYTEWSPWKINGKCVLESPRKVLEFFVQKRVGTLWIGVNQVDVHPITRESWLDVLTINKDAELSLSLISYEAFRKELALVVLKVDNASHCINLYTVGNAILVSLILIRRIVTSPTGVYFLRYPNLSSHYPNVPKLFATWLLSHFCF